MMLRAMEDGRPARPVDRERGILPAVLRASRPQRGGRTPAGQPPGRRRYL